MILCYSNFRRLNNYLFKGLPLKVQSHLLNMIKQRMKTNEIQLFVEKLDDIYDRCKDVSLSNNCEVDDYPQQLFAQRTHDEQNFILKFIKHLFRGSFKTSNNFPLLYRC